MPKINVCPKCLKESCSGNLYELIDVKDGYIKFPKTVFECETFIKEDKRYYHFVMGHGNEWDIEVKLL